MLSQLATRFFRFLILLLSFPSDGCNLSGRLILHSEGGQGFVVGGGDSGYCHVDLSGGVEDPISSLENTL